MFIVNGGQAESRPSRNIDDYLCSVRNTAPRISFLETGPVTTEVQRRVLFYIAAPSDEKPVSEKSASTGIQTRPPPADVSRQTERERDGRVINRLSFPGKKVGIGEVRSKY